MLVEKSRLPSLFTGTRGHTVDFEGGSLLAPKYDVMDLAAASASRPVSRNPKKGNF